MANTETKMSSELVQLLQGEKVVSLITMDKETKKPQLSVVSWVLADQDGSKIKIAVGHNASTVENVEADPSVVLGITGAGSCFSVKGTASVSDMFKATIKFRVITVEIEAVEDVMFYGGKITAEPAFKKTYDADLAEKLDREIYEVLKQ